MLEYSLSSEIRIEVNLFVHNIKNIMIGSGRMEWSTMKNIRNVLIQNEIL